MGGSPDYDSVGLLRAQTVGQPTYPENLKLVVGKEITSYEDSWVESEATYTYRVCLLLNGSPVVYSNVLSVTVPPAPPVMEIELSGLLRWYSGGLRLVPLWPSHCPV